MIEGCETPTQFNSICKNARKHTDKMTETIKSLETKWVKSKSDKEYIRQLQDFIDSVEMAIVKQHKKIYGDDKEII